MLQKYSSTYEIGYEGMLADNGLTDKINLVAVENMGYGLVVVKSTNGNAKLPSATGQKVWGITIKVENEDGYTKINKDISILKKGRIMVKVETDVSKLDPVYFRHTADGSYTTLGAVRNASGTGLDLLNGAVFMTSATAGKLAVVELNLP